MATSVENNSVFRSFFEKQKLTGPNFIDWYRQLQIVLSVEDKENYLEHLIPDAHAEQELKQTVREFHACKQEEGQSVRSYVLKIKSYIENLERLDQPVSLRLAKNQKKKSYKAAKGNQEKRNVKMGYAPVHAPSFVPKPKNPPPPKKENPAKDAICHQYDEVVIQKEVENQLGKTIKSLRSDRGDRMCLHVDADEYELRDLIEPANYKAALLDHESDKWLDDMNVKMQSMKDNEV
nr:zinc finger, CCHC-type [Tanacetum cinerariifolium]